jgi:hypothetical protein
VPGEQLDKPDSQHTRLAESDSLGAQLRFLDTLAKTDGAWLFAERRLHVGWLEERALS